MSSNTSKVESIMNTEITMKHWQKVSAYLVLYDALAVTVAYFLALLLRFDFQYSAIPVLYLRSWQYFAPAYALISIAVFWRLRLYNSIWRFASFTELERITLATVITTALHIIGVTIVLHAVVNTTGYSTGRMPFSYYIMGAIIQAILITAIRFSYRFVLLLRAARDQKSYSRVMLVGMYSKIGTS